MSFIETFTGKAVNPFQPIPSQICIEDIFQALRQINRFGGHTVYPYSVAEHSVLVLKILMAQGYKNPILLQGLMHDAAEAYMGDIPTPIKKELPGFSEAEDRLLEVIFDRFSIPWWTPEQRQIIHEADQFALAMEAKELMPMRVWSVPDVPQTIREGIRDTEGYSMRHWYEALQKSK